MGAVKHSNFFSTTLATPPTGTTEAAFTVTSAANIPTLAAGDWCYVVLKNASLTREVIKIGTISGVTLTPAAGGRGVDGSTAYASWVAGDVIELCFVNASLWDLLYEFRNSFYNEAGTFKSVFTNTNTAARTYTFPNVGGTVALTSNISALIPAGTSMPFAQAAAPTGWTQDTSDNATNRMLRVVNTAGGGVAGSHSPILNNVVAAHTHGGTTNTENAYHSHVDSGHSHAVGTGYFGASTGSGYTPITITGGIGGPQHTEYASSALGSETALHGHDFSTSVQPGAANWTPRYIDMIICAKN